MDEVVFHMVDMVFLACPQACNRAAICTLLYTCIHACIHTTIISTTKQMCIGSVVWPAFHRSLQGLLVCRSNAAYVCGYVCLHAPCWVLRSTSKLSFWQFLGVAGSVCSISDLSALCAPMTHQGCCCSMPGVRSPEFSVSMRCQ